eukprot:PITA_36555
MANLTTVPSCAITAEASSSTSRSYDVFINHRGPDVKLSFASHLYRRLRDHGLDAFLDKEEMEEGRKISSQIQEAIHGAYVQIAIFSPTYAESSWCLDELVAMENSGATILPIFFNVDPSVVRYTEKRGAYAEALLELQKKTTSDGKEPRYSSETIQNWRAALSDVADLSGFELKSFNGDEGELLDAVLQKVLKIVPKQPLYVAEHPTGLDPKIEELEEMVLQDQGNPKVIGIVGVGGIGKTTLAKQFFNCNRSHYRESSFLQDVRENCAKNSLNYMQNELIKDLKLENMGTECVEEGIGMLKRHPLSCHALIVFDDVSDAHQLEVLLSIKKDLTPESLILVTSRDKHVLTSSGVLESSLYNLKELNFPQSKQLFCSYAFHHPLPQPEFADLVDRFVRACNGLPLSLKVIGALVCGQNERYWTEQLDRLQHTLPIQIEGSLRISYDSLTKEDQVIFLDITCFFIGEDRDKAIRIWGEVGIQNLQNKYLLEVDNENKINMHDHIRDMGRNVAMEASMPHRIWTNNKTLQRSSPVRNEFRGVSIVRSSVNFFRDEQRCFSNTSSPEISRIKSPEVRYLFDNFHPSGMEKLQLVAIEEDHLDDILSRVRPPHLIWLRWYKCSHSSLPNWISLTKLRVLEVEGSKLSTLWPYQCQALPFDLRELNICSPLSEIPSSIEKLRSLEKIVLWNHSEAVTVERLPDEFCFLLSLKYLVLKGFSRLVSLPDSFGELTNLQLIDLEGASSLCSLPHTFGNLIRLRHLSLKGCEALIISNEAIGDIRTLEYLDLSFCGQVIDLPPQVAHQRSLRKLYLQGTKLKEFPNIIAGLCNLESLNLGSDLLEMLPPWIVDLKCLKMLSVSSSPQLKSLPESIGLLTELTHMDIKDSGIEYLPQHLVEMKNLKSLIVSDCPLRQLPFKRVGEREALLSLEGERALNRLNCSNYKYMSGLKTLELSEAEIREVSFEEGICPNLQRLQLRGCYSLRQIGGLSGLLKLFELDIRSCVNVKELPGLEALVSLERLTVEKCEKLEIIQGLGQITRLRELCVQQCRKIQELPGVEHLTSLEVLLVTRCENFRGISMLQQLTKLKYLDFSGCRQIRELPGVEYVTSLEKLGVSGCERLKQIPGLAQLTNLIVLQVSGCKEIRSIAGLGQLTTLRELYLRNCYGLREITGVEHLRSLEILDVNGCPRLQWDERGTPHHGI